jgi:hypothetical protein
MGDRGKYKEREEIERDLVSSNFFGKINIGVWEKGETV